MYEGKTLPVFTIHVDGEATTRPFIALFEPFSGKEGHSVEKIVQEKVNHPEEFTLLTMFNKDHSRQDIYQSVNPARKLTSKNGSFKGYFGVSGYKDGMLETLYLGKGTEISGSGYTIRSLEADGSANLAIQGNKLKITCNQAVELTVPGAGKGKVSLKTGNRTTLLKVSKSGDRLVFVVPAVAGGELSTE